MRVTKNTELGWGHYFAPTPKNIQKIGDALVALCLFVTGYAVIMESKWLAIVFIVIGGAGSFLQKFFRPNGT